MKIIVVGGETLAYHFAKMVQTKGYKVVVINKNLEFCQQLSKKLRTLVIHGDGSKRYVLEQAEPLPEDIVVTLTPKDQDNLVISLLARESFKVRKVVSLVNDPNNREIFEAFGINCISPTEVVADMATRYTFAEQIKSYFPISQNLSIIEIPIEEKHPVVSKQLKDIPMPHDSIVGSIVRNDEIIIPRGDTVVKAGDRLIILCNTGVQSEVLKVITGEV